MTEAEKIDQVKSQYRAIVSLARSIAKVHDDILEHSPQHIGHVLSVVGPQSARFMEDLGDIANAMDIVQQEDDWMQPVFERAHELYPAKVDDARVGRSPDLRWALERMVNLAGQARDLLDADEDMKCLKLLMAMAGLGKGYRADVDEIHAAMGESRAWKSLHPPRAERSPANGEVSTPPFQATPLNIGMHKALNSYALGDWDGGDAAKAALASADIAIEPRAESVSNVECQHEYRPAAFSESGAHVLGRRCARCEQVEPALPTHERKTAMTTTVKVLIEGNKACEVKVEGQGASDTATTVKPGSFTTKLIHGDQRVSVVEVGEFL